MGRVVVFDNPFESQEHRKFEHFGPLIDFLLAEFPNGFFGDHVTAFNGEKLSVENYDINVGADDVVSIVQLPAEPITVALTSAAFAASTAGKIVTAVISASISMALSYALSSFITPKTSSPSYSNTTSGSLGAADSVYTFSGSANTARIGGTIPVAYGRNLISPDLAMQPYVYFENNQQYLALLHCLGQGEFDIHKIFMAGNSIDELGSDVVDVRVYPPNSHQQRFGVIQNETGLFENVYTSPAVADQEFVASEVFTTSAHIGTWLWRPRFSDNKVRDYYRSFFDLYASAAVFAEAIRDGREVWLYVDSGPNQGNWRVEYIYNSGDTYLGDNTWVVNIRGWIAGSWPGGENDYDATVRLGFSPFTGGAESGIGRKIGPFRATPRGMTSSFLQYDIVFGSGVYRTSEAGTASPDTVIIHFVAEPINDNGDVVGPPVTYDYVETMSTNTPQRRTIRHWLPADTQWRVFAIRMTPKSPRTQDNSTCHWTGLKAVIGHPAQTPVYGNTTLLSVKIKATEGLASNAHSAMTVDCTRKHFGEVLRNPALVFVDILKNPFYGAKRPDSEIDFETVNMLANNWNSSNKVFDAVFDNETTVWDAIKLALQMQSAFPVALGAKVSIVEDKAHTLPSVVLDVDQVKNLVLSYSFVSSDDYDGIEGKFKNPSDNADEYIYWPPDCVNPEQMTLWGCKDYNQALEFVKLAWKKRQYRRQLFTLDLEAEGHTLAVGQPIGIKHPLIGEEAPVLAVVSSVTANSEFETTVEGFIYRSEVFS